MNKPHKIIVLFCCISLLYAGCKKEDEIDKLPPTTASGLGTFGCLINGKAWPNGVQGEHILDAFYYQGKFWVTYVIRDPNSLLNIETCTMQTREITKPGIYFLSFKDISINDFTVNHGAYTYASGLPLNLNNYAYMNISRFDTVNYIISGTFSFSLYDLTGTHQIKIDKGRFDVNYF
ncbi:MAG: hypothetical protein K1X81_11105 [Bacteroidia bacterium]|nr:hypothetical protein [Bacteroidia bacterium]